MRNDELYTLLNENIQNFSEEELNRLGKNLKKKSIFLFIVLVSLASILISSNICLYILFIMEKLNINFLGILFLLIGSIVCFVFAFKTEDPTKFKLSPKDFLIYKANKKNNDEKKRLNRSRSPLEGKEVSHVVLVDSYTEISDKLHPILNWQEIIQTRYVVFNVFFKDGTSKTIKEKENSELFNYLMSFVGEEKKQQPQTLDSAKEIRKFKKLLDDGILTQEEFEQKKKSLLEK